MVPTRTASRTVRAAACLVLVLAGVFASSAAASERHPTLIELESEVMCPTCHTTLDQSDAPVARRIEAYIQQRIDAGDTESEIKAKLVAQFGQSILAQPSHRGLDLLAWWLPLGGAGLGAALLAVGAYRWSRRENDEREHSGSEPLDPELEQLLDRELADYPG